MRHGSLFSGIGGFDLAAEWMGWENVFHCEISEFPRQILKYHFPNSICYEDIKKTDFTKHRGEIDIISGGFPCQPYSNAGKRRGKEDDRHLWPEMLRVIREVQPRFVVGENVSGLLSWNNGMVFHEIITDLENEGYETQAFHIPACATNAPHRRDRIWFVAYSKHNRTRETRNSRTDEGCESSSLHEEKQRGNTETVFNNGLRDLQESTSHSKGDGRTQRGETFDGRKINQFENWDKIWDKFTSNGKQSNAPHSDGTEQGNNFGEDIGKEGEIRWGEKSDVFGELRSDGIAADTESERTRKQSSEDRGWEDRRSDNDGETWDAADTYGERLEGKCWAKRKLEGERRFSSSGTRNNECTAWANFPTQSPICGGDDGISAQLDGITFSKWRNESIKGYGNAVVPQVVYQIFKAIEKTML